MKRNILAIVLILFCTFLSLRDIFNAGYFPMHDDTQVSRVIVMGRALRNGQFPVRWVSDLGYGYGYPIFNFYGPLPYYVGGVFYASGVDGLVATKIMFFMGVLLSGISMYFVMKSIGGRTVGLVAAIAYLYIPYRAVDVFVRGAVGEYWTLIWIPLVFYGLYFVLVRKNWQSAIVGAIGLCGVIISHTILGFITTIGIIVIILFLWLLLFVFKKISRPIIVWHSVLLVLGLALSAWFWMPAFAEMRFTNVASQISSTADYHNHFVCLPQLWDSPWGFGGSVAGCADGLSFRLGKIHVLLALIGIMLALFLHKRLKKYQYFFLYFISSIGALSIFLMTNASAIFWESIPFMAYVQYPWRFMTIVSVALAMLTSSLVLFVFGRWQRWGVAFLLLVLIILFNQKLFHPQWVYPVQTSDFEKTDVLRFQQSKISDEYLPPAIPRPKQNTDVVHDTISPVSGITVGTEIDTETTKRFAIINQLPYEMEIHLADFPGWEYIVNGVKVTPRIVSGQPVLYIPSGRTVSEVYFRDTPIRLVGNIISIFACIGLIYVISYGKKTNA